MEDLVRTDKLTAAGIDDEEDDETGTSLDRECQIPTKQPPKMRR